MRENYSNSHFLWDNGAYMLNEFKEAVAEKANLSKFEEWFVWLSHSNKELLSKMIKESVISNPFEYVIDHENKIVANVADKDFYLRKLKSQARFFYHKEEILAGVTKLSKEIKDWDVSDKRVSYVDILGSDSDRIYAPPLLVVLSKLGLNKELIETIIKTNGDYKELIESEVKKKGDDRGVLKGLLLTEKKDLRRSLDYSEDGGRCDIIYDDLALYQNDIREDFYGSKKFKSSGFYKNIVCRLIEEDDVQTITRKVKNKHLVATFGDFADDVGCGIKSVDMLKIVTNAISIPKLYNKNEIDEKHEFVFLASLQSLDLFKIAINDFPSIKASLENNAEVFLGSFLENTRSRSGWNYNKAYTDGSFFKKIKYLVDTYGIPIDKLSFLNKNFKFVVMGYDDCDNATENIEWAIKHGADPRDCGAFMRYVTVEVDRLDGGKLLKGLKRRGLFDPLSPDSLFHILNNAKNKFFLDFIKNATPEQFSRYTLDGIPAWFGFGRRAYANNSYSKAVPNLIYEKVENMNQTTKSGLHLMAYLIKERVCEISLLANPRRYFEYGGEFIDPIVDNYINAGYFTNDVFGEILDIDDDMVNKCKLAFKNDPEKIAFINSYELTKKLEVKSIPKQEVVHSTRKLKV